MFSPCPEKPFDQNGSMDVKEVSTDPADVLADLQAICRQAVGGATSDPELVCRLIRRAEQARQEIVRTFGIQDIGVQIIREMRDAG